MDLRSILALVPAIAVSGLFFLAAGAPSAPAPAPGGHEILLQSRSWPHASRPVPPIAFPAIKDWRSLRMTLVRGACFGACPIYQVEVAGDGTVTYAGEAFVLVPGRHVTHIGQDKVRALFEAFRKANFFSLFESYRSNITDNPSYVVMLAFDGRKTAVLDYIGREVGMPPQVSQLEDLIDMVSGAPSWVSGDGGTVAALKAEGWNFRARTAANDRMVMDAAANGTDDAVRDLLAQGLTVTGRTGRYGCRAAAFAASRDRPVMLQALLAAGAPLRDTHVVSGTGPGRYDSESCDVLMSAVHQGAPETIALVLARHPDLRQRGAEGVLLALGAYWPRGDGSSPDFAKSAQLLLAAGADPYVKDAAGHTARDVARIDKRDALAAVLTAWMAAHPR